MIIRSLRRRCGVESIMIGLWGMEWSERIETCLESREGVRVLISMVRNDRKRFSFENIHRSREIVESAVNFSLVVSSPPALSAQCSDVEIFLPFSSTCPPEVSSHNCA